MIILDENVANNQRLRLLQWRIHVRQIGFDFGRSGMLDEEVIPFLQQHRRITFFTADEDYYKRWLCHPSYCLVYLSVDKLEIANAARQLLRHPEFNTTAKRMGAVIRITKIEISVWRSGMSRELHIKW